MNKMYSFNEIGLIPSWSSNVSTRKEVNPFDKDGKLPIFVAPMTCILNEDNFATFNESKVIPIYPVRVNKNPRLFQNESWQALTLDDFKYYFVDHIASDINYHICLDTANGHMVKIYDLVKAAKQNHKNLVVMVGNIANPDAYWLCKEAGVDYVRVGIGGGSGCLTSELTGFHTSLPWLLERISIYKSDSSPKVIADGGINSIDRIIKALALGADYVMCGKLFAYTKEACGHLYDGSKIYYGQSSMQGQLDRFGYVKGNIEGTGVPIEEKYTLDEFNGKVEDVLRSALSYAGCFDLSKFIGKVDWEVQSIEEYNCYHK